MSGTLAPLPVSISNHLPIWASSGVWFGGTGGSRHDAALAGDTTKVNEQSPRALVVDDAPDVVEMLAMLLRHSGYTVTTASSAPDALTAAQEGLFDVVVSDIGMPGMNGYELAEALRALPDYVGVPMVALTGFSMYADRERALASGFNAFLTKPIDPTALIELIARLRGREGSEGQ
jgi:two-component system CheB/CheR fusion protein